MSIDMIQQFSITDSRNKPHCQVDVAHVPTPSAAKLAKFEKLAALELLWYVFRSKPSICDIRPSSSTAEHSYEVNEEVLSCMEPSWKAVFLKYLGSTSARWFLTGEATCLNHPSIYALEPVSWRPVNSNGNFR